MREWRILTIAALAAAVSMAVPISAAIPKAEKHPYRKEYVKNVYGPGAAARVVAGAALSRRKGTFGSKLLTGAEAHVAGGTTKYAIAALRHEDLHYYRSDKSGFGPRLKHALVSTVVVRKTNTGRKTAAVSRLSGASVAGLVAGSAATGGIALGANAGMNVTREFWPKKKHKAARARPT